MLIATACDCIAGCHPACQQASGACSLQNSRLSAAKLCLACPVLKEAFEACEAINVQSEEWREELAARHLAKRKEVAAAHGRAVQAVARAASASAE